MQIVRSGPVVHSKSCDSLRQVAWHDVNRLKVPSLIQGLFIGSGVALLVLLAVRSDAALDKWSAESEPRADFIYVPPSSFLKAISLGYQHTFADVLWFRTINYFGRHHRGDRTYPWLAYMCDVVTDLDPSAEDVYAFGGIILPWEADRIDEGIALLEKGSRSLPFSWRLRYLLGFSYYFFRNDLSAASRNLEAAARLPDAPEFLTRMTATILAAHEGADNAIEFLTQVARESPDPEMRATMRQRIRELSLTQAFDAVDAAIKRFHDRFRRLPNTLSELVSAGVIEAIPPDPCGGVLILDRHTGAVRSSVGGKPLRMGSSRLRESFLKKDRTPEGS